MDGFWYSTRHVGKIATRACLRPMLTVIRLRNQVLKRVLEYGGSNRCDEMPAVVSTTLRRSDPGFAVAALAIGATRVASFPIRSVRPSTLVVTRVRDEIRRHGRPAWRRHAT